MSSRIIGLTGGIGSGKSFVSSIFSDMGIPIYDSDSNAKRLMNEETSLIKAIKDLFGKNAYNKTGLNTDLISKEIFNKSDLREKLNSVVHPAVRNDFLKWANQHETAPYVINEAALFVENNTYPDFDFLITVVSPLPLRISRVIERSQLPEKRILQIIESQASDELKILKSNFVIYNDQLNTLFQQVAVIHRIIS